jgi:signal transduction histidine kinase/CheY-like chemotaxis protein/HPt (histidine-containing phosphotransfer) domain-containing protein
MAGSARTSDSAIGTSPGDWRPTATLSRRLARLILATALLSALVGAVLSGINLTLEYRARMRGEADVAIESQRELIQEALGTEFHGGAVAAARNIAEKTHAIAVRISDASAIKDSLIAESAAAGAESAIPLPYIRITRELNVNGDVIGQVEVRLSSRPVFMALVRYLITALVAVLIVAGLALLMVRRMRRQVSEPIGRLLDMMDKVARTKNFELQATPEGPDEIGSLAISFNALLCQIHARNQTLAIHRRELQELVSERTRSFERAAQEAEIASRAKGDFLARMSHEIRTPMNGVIGMAELLENTKLEEKQHHMLQTMRSSANSLLDIINDILDFSRIEAGQLQVLKTQFSPVELIEEICELLAPPAHERDLELVCDIDSRVPEACAGDPLRLRQIVTNLLGNAIKYTQKGSVILRASAISQPGDVVQLRVEVEDTGYGIPEEQLHKMFEPFTQGDSFETRKQGGTGLGLAITKQLVSLLGGDLNVTSKLGSGSKFWVTIPLQVQTDAAAAPGWQSGLKGALIVQNDVSGARVVARILEESGARVTTSRTGHETIDLLVVEEFDLIVVDELLPDMNGYELIDRLRSSGKAKSMAIIMLTTTKPAAAGLERASEPDARVSKPVRRIRLREAVEQALGRGDAPADGRHAAGGAAILNLNVLLVEDSPVNREVARGMLESLGCTVETASDGNIGVEEALSWNYDVVLMDCQMPLLDGFEATSRIRVAEAANGRAAIPVIALTANALQGDRERCLAAGMTDFISKPFTIKKLQAALTAATTGKPVFELALQNPRIRVQQADEPPVVDSRHIDELRSLNKPGLLQDAIAMFHKQASATLDNVEHALRANSAPDLEQHFHALKSCSLSVGAKRFAAVAGDCEQAVRQGDLAAAARLAGRLRPEYASLREALSGISQTMRQAV